LGPFRYIAQQRQPQKAHKTTLAEQREALRIAIESIDDTNALADLLLQAQIILGNKPLPQPDPLLMAELERRMVYVLEHPDSGIELDAFIREIEEDDHLRQKTSWYNDSEN